MMNITKHSHVVYRGYRQRYSVIAPVKTNFRKTTQNQNKNHQNPSKTNKTQQNQTKPIQKPIKPTQKPIKLTLNIPAKNSKFWCVSAKCRARQLSPPPAGRRTRGGADRTSRPGLRPSGFTSASASDRINLRRKQQHQQPKQQPKTNHKNLKINHHHRQGPPDQRHRPASPALLIPLIRSAGRHRPGPGYQQPQQEIKTKKD